MPDLTFLALIPTDTEHGRMLLADGECGAKPPKLYRVLSPVSASGREEGA